MSYWSRAIAGLKSLANISDNIDTTKAEQSIRNNIHFKGPNVWILAFSIIIASVGLNLNSTAVIIGAMLISPLMGPIFGIGLGLGINDTSLIKSALKNLLVMVIVSLIASSIFFIISPLTLLNPTELESRTNPTIYDVLIALFGGSAGIFEMCRKEKGTVLSGVAIATALMPPLCTAGYGLAHGNIHFLGGALYLFLINGIFITLATYLATKYLGFKGKAFENEKKEKRTRRLITSVIVIVTIPSLLTAFNMVRINNFTQRIDEFVTQNRALERGYIMDVKIDKHKGGSAEIFIAGEPLRAYERENLIASAELLGIKESQISFKEQSSQGEASDSEKLMQGIYERTDAEINKRESQIRSLENQLRDYRNAEIPYTQITREIRSQYPEIEDLYLSRGASVASDSTLTEKKCILVVAKSRTALSAEKRQKLTDWLKIRLNDTTVVVMNNH